MTKGLVTALCLSAATALLPLSAGAQDLVVSPDAGWAERIGAILRSREVDLSTSFRLFNPERLHPEPAERAVEKATWDVMITRSSRDLPSPASEGWIAGLILRF
ncbi:hypothetical protein Dshi_3315 [Dinoroseobacter shibae DFL 12 = DSM 16493]|jgi:hypothetical protein|uniref:Uncharacterized protein n=1 Tax=Dinoroseobacter shibae (strain DSM 16493 / NCIMB 14021 / DFL 12) TaxID=398580 RepID=A8LNF4_DINSH|nr:MULTISPECIES: hypothetical protein [Dinoroseobacter]ABV95048.1 hypothetical protein Dshi_3315 [Dinoroseobacter shibae DFL 12 = DSM 16493]MDD9717830.1 hypothetical protein [Dinoroseobacter sp. PD6]URF46463.1 hypothetical protein M8008_17045 [Dinoroseobacter shibae]URF50769.1 hypothetical protein M8007_17045 [Dinoroseobacter shibae]